MKNSNEKLTSVTSGIRATISMILKMTTPLVDEMEFLKARSDDFVNNTEVHLEILSVPLQPGEQSPKLLVIYSGVVEICLYWCVFLKPG